MATNRSTNWTDKEQKQSTEVPHVGKIDFHFFEAQETLKNKDFCRVENHDWFLTFLDGISQVSVGRLGGDVHDGQLSYRTQVQALSPTLRLNYWT